MKPKIGVVVCGFIENKQFVTNAYIQSIRYSGGIPLILPLIRSDQVLKEYAALCDGFLFCGGNDITPLLFGQEPKKGNGQTNISLDLFQIRLMKEVLKTNKPVFSICRGMQVLNVACGGTIFQDISLQPGTHLDHMQQSDTRSEVSHKIHVRPGTQLKKYVGSLVYVNSYHHQTLDRIGKNLTVSAVATDQTVEAIELPSHPFAIGVQWHPECMYRTSSDMRELFGSFILCATHGGAVSAE
ncbi:MAG: gamma-glutamyl-gamma-aminobutyrate hydrolase family protein [Ruminococcus sp.]|nr:gamma-glutamyl-gamma-aminobutyrate hydrolase family protein [Ruminococcus sp.]